MIDRARVVVGEGVERTALTIAVMNNAVVVEADTGTPEAAAALRDSASDLGAALRDQGMSLADMSAGHNGTPHSHDRDDESTENSQIIENRGEEAARTPPGYKILAIA